MRLSSVDDVIHRIAALPSGPEGPRIVVSGNFGSPGSAVASIDAGLDRYRLWALNGQKGLPDREGVILETCFVGAGMRKSPRLRYVPSRLSLVPRLFRDALRPEVVLLHTTVPRDGRVSMGTEVNVLPAAVESVRRHGGLVVAVMNPNMPYTYGDGELTLDEIDLAIEVEEPLASPPAIPLDDTSQAIGERVAALVGDGSTLQLGIGAVPDATLHGLTDRSGLRLWSEMVSDGLLALDRAGALDAQAPIVATFMFGSPELYAWVDGNPRLRMLRTEVVNAPARIAANPKMVSVNSALQVDLFGQANASRISARIYSGFGGQTDFTVGALHSDGGQAIMALRSWHPRADVSTIVPLVDEPVTSFQHSAVVTDQGVAAVFGCSEREQAENLITKAAHPDVREELWEEAVALGLADA